MTEAMATDGMGMCIRLMNPNRQSSDETLFHAFNAEEDNAVVEGASPLPENTLAIAVPPNQENGADDLMRKADDAS